MSTSPDVSVIVPVYNAADYLKSTIGSILKQELGSLTIEIIVIDDGSTDDSLAIVREIADHNPELQVATQKNSGWAGAPRNRGIEKARGRYLFFCDADDFMPPQALRQLVSFADEHHSDVVIPKMVGAGGRGVRRSIFEKTEVDADWVKVFRANTPQKLFRRELVERHHLRFPEERIRLEDALFTFRAYTLASRVSIYADDVCYELHQQENGGNISSTGIDPIEHSHTVYRLVEIVTSGLPASPTRDDVSADVIRRLALGHWKNPRMKGRPLALRRAWMHGHRRILDRFLTPDILEYFDPVEKARIVAIQNARLADLIKLISVTNSKSALVACDDVRLTDETLTLGGVVQTIDSTVGLATGEVTVTRRGTERSISVVAALEALPPDEQPLYLPGARRFTARISKAALYSLGNGKLDLHLVVSSPDAQLRTRISVAAALNGKLTAIADGRIRLFATDLGNLSVLLGKPASRRIVAKAASYVPTQLRKPVGRGLRRLSRSLKAARR
ncbi:glycosyltransferase family 2 protein [Saxibacter everestensis]|uniref:Glycosyltransferase family 2 protein n=1 Tax=Saxibacter everestensis TaxID=2909229 RepID=A0ABY8QTL2_9MICO|nr:glycosyltransferase family 2 protein [Brevibacteriaceae bacterium ZFBP1038]